MPDAADSQTYFPDLPAAIDLPAHGARGAGPLAGREVLRAIPGRHRGAPAVDLLRGPADRERHARRASHRGAGVQGRFPPVQDHAGVPRARARPAGTATGCRSRWRWSGNLGCPARRTSRRYGIAEFNARCRESVLRHVDAFEELTVRLGYWVDLSARLPDHGRQLHRVGLVVAQGRSSATGLLVKDFRISPYCPRCETPLSDHEMGQPDVYRPVTDPVGHGPVPAAHPAGRGQPAARRAPTCWSGRPRRGRWCPTPRWPCTRTRPTRSRASPATARPWWWPRRWSPRVLGEGWQVAGHRARCRAGRRDLPAAVRPGRDPRRAPGGAGRVRDHRGRHRPGAHGTGVRRGRHGDGPGARAAGGQPDPAGRPVRGLACRWSAGCSSRKPTRRWSSDLAERGLLFQVEQYQHSYPHCWRCHTPLLYYALPSWYIRTTQIKDQMLAENERTNWQPPTIKHGRYGEWLRNNVDWALSRTRYWGTPLPIWECGQQHLTCVGSLAELSELAGRDLSDAGPAPAVRGRGRDHLPGLRRAGPPGARGDRRLVRLGVDAVRPARRAAGATRSEFERAYPAQFICEAIDQTRGWFYSLMAVGTLVFGRSSYENVVCLGLVVDERGRKMSKHLGNVLEPIPLMEAHGADAVRWFFAAVRLALVHPADRRQHAGRDRPQGAADLLEHRLLPGAVRQRRGRAGAGLGPGPGGRARRRSRTGRCSTGGCSANCTRRPATSLTRWRNSTPPRPGRRLAAFIDDMSNWYVRRSRRRFWDGPGTAGRRGRVRHAVRVPADG